MHGRIATYRISGDPHELARKAEEGMLPIFQAQPGFRAYNLVVSGDLLTSMSAWDTIEEAEAATPGCGELDRREHRRRHRARRRPLRRDPARDGARREPVGGSEGIARRVRRGAASAVPLQPNPSRMRFGSTQGRVRVIPDGLRCRAEPSWNP